MQTKKCNKCGETKDISKYRVTGKYTRGECYECEKDCARSNRIEYYKKNKAKELWKMKTYYTTNIDSAKEYKIEYRKKNTEKLKVYGANYYINNLETRKIKAHAYFKKFPDKFRDYNAKRRAFKKNVMTENIKLREVYEKCNWICGICGKKINKKLTYPSSMSASIDHILPLSKGGTHTYSNVQPAHLTCNHKKHNSVKNLQLKLA